MAYDKDDLADDSNDDLSEAIRDADYKRREKDRVRSSGRFRASSSFRQSASSYANQGNQTNQLSSGTMVTSLMEGTNGIIFAGPADYSAITSTNAHKGKCNRDSSDSGVSGFFCPHE